MPHLADIEVTQALRRYANDGELEAADAAVALEDFRSLDLQRYAHEPLLERVWELRQNLSAYDAVYIALAEVLDTVLLTCDGRPARARGVTRRVELVKPTACWFNCQTRMVVAPAAAIRRFADVLGIDSERIRLWMFARAAAERRDTWSDDSIALGKERWGETPPAIRQPNQAFAAVSGRCDHEPLRLKRRVGRTGREEQRVTNSLDSLLDRA